MVFENDRISRPALALGALMTVLAAPPVSAAWQAETIAGMQVELYLPESEAAGGRPLMVTLHGCAQTGALYRRAANWEATAEEFGMVVALPTVPDGGKLFGCWDYYGKTALGQPAPQRRDNRDNDNVLGLVADLLGRAELGIDPDQVYLSGLSSGAGQTAVLACLAPDVFAGVGIVAGPAIGTGAFEIKPLFSLPVTRDEVRDLCLEMAGDQAGALATQIASIAVGNQDDVVNPLYSTLNAATFAELYGATPAGADDLAGAPGFQVAGTVERFDDPQGLRVELVTIDGMGHAWPAGTGPGPEVEFIASEGLDYPAYLTAFLMANNRRAASAPVLEAAAAVDEAAATVTITGEASAEGAVELGLVIEGLSDPKFTPVSASVDQPQPPAFAFTSEPLPSPQSYRATVTGTSAGGSTAVAVVFGVGPDAPFPPELLGSEAVVQQPGCIAAFGAVSDRNNDLDGVTVAVDGGEALPALLITAQDAWALEEPICGVAVGPRTVTVRAVDQSGLEAIDIVAVVVRTPFPKFTAPLNDHVLANRLRFYPEAGHFGSADVSLPELMQRFGPFAPFDLFEVDGRFFVEEPGA